MLAGADRADVDVEPSYNGWAVLPKVTNKTPESANSVVAYGGFDKIGPGTRRSLP